MEKPILHDRDIDPAPLLQRKVAILGYGNQGRPQALNLRDSGVRVVIGVRAESEKRRQALEDGFSVLSLSEAADRADVLMLMLPDERIAEIYEADIAPILRRHPHGAKYLGFAHGLAIHAGWIRPQEGVSVFLVAPKGQGRGVRNKYLAGSGVPGLYAVARDAAGDTERIALAYAKAIGCGKAGILPTSFQEETEADLFSEQAVLCGGLTRLIQTAFETLTERGFSSEVAYFECLYEVKLIADLLHERGIAGMREGVSSTALFGDLSRGDRIIDAHVRENMRNVLSEIQSGRFAAEMRDEFNRRKPQIREALFRDFHHPIEEAHRRLANALGSGASV